MKIEPVRMAPPNHTAIPASISPEVLALLRCPNTGQPLELKNIGGRSMLVTADGRWGYLIRDGIPILLPDAAVQLPPHASKY